MGLNPSVMRERLSCLQMFLQSAELRLIGAKAHAEIEMNCELTNIARSICQIKLTPVDIIGQTTVGHIEIPTNRPIMRAEPARPIAIVIALEDEIVTNGHGDIFVPYPTRVGVVDLSWVFPLK